MRCLSSFGDVLQLFLSLIILSLAHRNRYLATISGHPHSHSQHLLPLFQSWNQSCPHYFRGVPIIYQICFTISNYVDEMCPMKFSGIRVVVHDKLKIRCRITFDPHGASLHCCCSFSRLRRVRSTVGLINGTQSPWTVTSLAMGLNIEYLNKELTYNDIY